MSNGPQPNSRWQAIRRFETLLAVVRGDDERRDYRLTGNFEPETFSYDASKLFVIEYLPAAAPTQYTLRLLDLTSGEVGEVFDAHGGEREPMRGTARTQVYSPDGKRLYTYYQIFGEPYVEDGEQPYSAFVHVLDLEEGWAHCVDLPQPFGTGPAVEPALAVSPDGSKAYVGDQGLGLLAEVDTQNLKVTRTHKLTPDDEFYTGAATVTDASLWLAFGAKVTEIDTATLNEGMSFTTGGAVTAIRREADGDRLFVALPNRLAIYDSQSGRALGYVLGEKGPFTSADRSEGRLTGPRDVIKCAC